MNDCTCAELAAAASVEPREPHRLQSRIAVSESRSPPYKPFVNLSKLVTENLIASANALPHHRSGSASCGWWCSPARASTRSRQHTAVQESRPFLPTSVKHAHLWTTPPPSRRGDRHDAAGGAAAAVAAQKRMQQRTQSTIAVLLHRRSGSTSGGS